MYRVIKNFIKKAVTPVSREEDSARSEFIFNILILSITGLSFSAFVINLVDWLRGFSPSVSVPVVFFIFLFFISLYFLARKGYLSLSSFIFCLVFFILNSYTALKYGVDIPAGLLTYALIIVMVGVLRGTRDAFITTCITIVSILYIGHIQINNLSELQLYWRNNLMNTEDLVMFSVIFLIIATVSWLSNREIEKSLIRARKSEADLKIERDSLEVKVEERTRAIKEMQLEKMGQLYRFAEFGRLSSGLFHDLMNPLTAVSLNMEIVKNREAEGAVDESRTYLDRALSATHKMEDFVTAVRKQISKQENKINFSLNEEIRQVVEILTYKANRLGATLVFDAKENIEMYGDNIKFSQVVLNLIGNAIDAYTESKQDEKMVSVYLSAKDSSVELKIQDHGVGIAPENKDKIFEPFFTTKGVSSGMGIGLSLVKRIIEKDFNGSIAVSSGIGVGSTFTISFPHVTQSKK